eukprot:7198039-Alexandrium_andersonii.AAC.1
MSASLVGSEMCIRDSSSSVHEARQPRMLHAVGGASSAALALAALLTTEPSDAWPPVRQTSGSASAAASPRTRA